MIVNGSSIMLMGANDPICHHLSEKQRSLIVLGLPGTKYVEIRSIFCWSSLEHLLEGR